MISIQNYVFTIVCYAMNKTRSHLQMFIFFKLTHRCFKSSPPICSSWIDHVDFLYFLAQKDSCQPNWHRLLHFPSSVPPLLQPTLPRRVMLPLHGPKWARCLRFIFRQHFVPLSRLSSQNWSIESTPLRQSPSLGRTSQTLQCYKKVISTLTTSPPLNHVSILPPS
jgi:hypothetical protein